MNENKIRMNNTGVTMLLKAMGFDPQELMNKGVELEAHFKGFCLAVQVKVEQMDARLNRMEAMLITLCSKVEESNSAIVPAGESSVDLHEPRWFTEQQEQQQQKEHNSHGRHPRNSRTTQRTRKAS